MTMNLWRFLAAAYALALMTSCGNTTPPEPYGPLPSERQLQWQKMEMNLFAHFGPNTFTGREWGLGTEAEEVFNPTDLDCGQWASIAKAAGFKGIIITAKHHDGFCLWPNPMSAHTVAASPWRDGGGDVLKDLSEACSAQGLKFGVYISPWDRNDPHYGTPEYNEVFIKTLEDVHGGRYGEIFEQWFDGANGEGPNGKRQTYDWPAFHETVRRLQSGAVMFSDVGPDCRWVGNERGAAGKTNWSALDTKGFSPGAGSPPTDTLGQGNVHGTSWIPAECDVSIRPGWFWRESENDKIKSVKELLDIYYSSVGRNSLLLLNVPPDTTGRFHPADSARLMEFRSALDSIFSIDLAAEAAVKASSKRGLRFRPSNILKGGYDSFWVPNDNDPEPSLIFSLSGKKTFNRIVIQEYIPLGQRIKSFTIEAELPGGGWETIASETTIGYKRIVTTDEVTTSRVRLTITGSFAPPALNGFGLFLDRISE